MRFVIDCLYLIAALAYSPFMLYRCINQKRYRTGWAQRFGKIGRKRPGNKCIWLHAVSLGEINAARSIVDALAAKYPDYEIAISTTTDTGQSRAIALFGEKHTVFYFPFDFSLVMSRAFKQINPNICLLMELEVWYNFVQIANQRSVPVVVVNGRLSAKSFSRYKKIRALIAPMFSKLALVLAQTHDYAQRFIYLGCPESKVIVTGSLKYDTAEVTDKIEGADKLASQLGLGSEPLWVAGGTGPGEEQIILNVYKTLLQNSALANLRLAIVPRKPERFDEVASLIEREGIAPVRYSKFKNASQPAVLAGNSIILGDTMGDLRKFYSLATVIFVGRSLVPMGGSDMMEAAALGKCTIFGPHCFNFQQTVDVLLAGNGAIMCNNEIELAQAIITCLTDKKTADMIAANGQQIIKSNQGATAASLEAIATLIESA